MYLYWAVAVWTLVLSRTGVANQLAVSLEDPESGFFIKTPHGEGSSNHSFVITRPGKGPIQVKARFGEFEKDVIVNTSLLHSAQRNDSFLFNSYQYTVEGFDVSAHVVTPEVNQERPRLQVLFHGVFHGVGSSRWCMQMHILKDNEELHSVCALSEDHNVCIADRTLPTDWLATSYTESVEVFYTAQRISRNIECHSSSYNSRSHSGFPINQRVPKRTYVATVTLTSGDTPYEELKEDQHILIYNPQTSFYPGSKIIVPVKLQAESDLTTFVIKVKARHGIHLIGAERDSETWAVRPDINSKQHQGTVTASVSNPETYRTTSSRQDVFHFTFEIDPSVSGESRARLAFTLLYERTGNKETYTVDQDHSIENRVVARIQIQADNTYAIVPVTKVTEIINTAVLTGIIQRFPMSVYSVSPGGGIQDITAQTTCHSDYENVLKVEQTCGQVYVDGSETAGHSSVSVIAKYGRHSKFLSFRVWVPDEPLTVELSDSKLSQVRLWKAPKQVRRTPSVRSTRGVNYGIQTQPMPVVSEQGMRREDYCRTCYLRYQQARVEVYTRFVLPDNMGKHYLMNHDMLFRITDLVKDMLRIADTSIANLTAGNTVVKGLQKGRTEIQVTSSSGHILGAKEIIVGSDKVEIEHLDINVITGLGLMVVPHPPDHDSAGYLIASVGTTDELHRKDQEGFLDISMVFDDGTRAPLSDVDPNDYSLDFVSMKNHVVEALQGETSSPRFRAVRQGKGKLLNVSLKLGDDCRRKSSFSLASADVNITVNFSKSSDEPPNDAPGPSGQEDDSKTIDETKGNSKSEEVKNPPSSRLQQPIFEATNLTPLEIGMYVLLGVFCLAIIVFMVNCMIFVFRYRNKRSARKSGKEHVAQAADWVWIGRDTLERNAINTTCRQTLMPDADFNGNHSGQQQLLPPNSQPSSNRNSSASSGGASGSLRGSNRNSMVSTYKGSECSIRITANPIMDENDNPQADEANQSGASAPLMPQVQGPSKSLPRRSVRRFSGRGLSTIGSSLDSDSLRRRKLAELEEAVASGSELEFDYESLGMTYEELMEYFDNLKESTA